jgi:hypothetical protein
VEAHQITESGYGDHVTPARAGESAAPRSGQYVRDRTASELAQAGGELAQAQALAPRGGLAAALIAAYAQAVTTAGHDDNRNSVK